MIEEEIYQQALRFANDWTKKLSLSPLLRLDFSWPSVGAVDLITFHLRGEITFDTEKRELLRGAAAYVGVIAHDCWSRFDKELNVELKKTKESNPDYVLFAKGGQFLQKGEEFSVTLVQSLRKILAFEKEAFIGYGKKARVIPADHNLLSLFGLGLITGYCPLGQGAWRECSELDFVPYLKKAEIFLAESCANYYKAVFPNEPLGQHSKLYLSELIIPPAQHSEPFPACRAVTGAIRYLKGVNATPEEMLQLGENLALFPDELISATGFSLAASLCKDTSTISSTLKALSAGKGSYGALLRPAVITARALLTGVEGDFLQYLSRDEIEQARSIFRVEKKLHLLPTFRLSETFFGNQKLTAMMTALSWFNPNGARSALEALPKDQKVTEVLLQGIYLDILLGNIARAENDLLELENKFNSKKEDLPVELHELRGLLLLMKGDSKQSLQYYRSCFHSPLLNEERRLEIGAQLVRAYILEHDYRSAIDATGLLLKEEPLSLDLHLYRAVAFKESGKVSDLKQEIEILTKLSPTDRRVFSLLEVLSELEEGGAS